MASTTSRKRQFDDYSQGQRPDSQTTRGRHSDYGSQYDRPRPTHGLSEQQSRLNQAQEAEQMQRWVAQEDEFVLRQSKKKAAIRLQGGRAKTIDRLVITLSVIDQSKDLLEDDGTSGMGDEIVDPSSVFVDLTQDALYELDKDIDAYLKLEKEPQNIKYWSALAVICKKRIEKSQSTAQSRRGNSSVMADVEKMLSTKTMAQLQILQTQIKAKLSSDEPMDVEYWTILQDNVAFFIAKAELHAIYQVIISHHLQLLRQENRNAADSLAIKLSNLIETSHKAYDGDNNIIKKELIGDKPQAISYSDQFERQPLLRIKAEDKSVQCLEESVFLESVLQERKRIVEAAYIPERSSISRLSTKLAGKKELPDPSDKPRFAAVGGDDFSSATTALYEREAARGVQEDEEIFVGEEEVATRSKSQWVGKYRARKPRYFNRVQMGFEWNKYNQTHYDHENPPPKIVQGYKFNVFYPELIDKTKAPTYKIEREGGRRRGESHAPAGEEETCLIRFMSGPPYEDLAFRILDKEWDFSSKRDRGFRSSFDKGILQLHFQFKKVYYRK